MTSLLLSFTLAALLPAVPTQCGKPKLEQMTRDAEVIFVGEVVEVERPALIQSWSGLTVYKQHVRYNVTAVLKGEFSEAEVWVGYPIYYRSLLADKDVPQLSPEVFKTNNAHIVFMKHVKERNPPPFPGPSLQIIDPRVKFRCAFSLSDAPSFAPPPRPSSRLPRPSGSSPPPPPPPTPP